MRKGSLLLILAILLVAGIAGNAWYWARARDPMGMARSALRQGDLRAAQLALRTVVREDIRNGEAHFRLGTVQLQLGDAMAAEREFRLAEVAGWTPEAVKPLLARAILAQARYKDVLKDFPASGTDSADDASILVVRALAQLGLKDLVAAQATAEEANRLAPELVEVPLAAARIALARDEPSLAESNVARALEINPHSVEALALQGALRHARGDDEAALGSFDAALAITPDVTSLRLERAHMLIMLGRNEKARQDIDAVMKTDARNPAGNYLVAILAARAQEWQRADAALQMISPIMSRFPRGEYFRALVKINMDQVEQAIESASKYLARVPRDSAGYKLLADIYARVQRSQQVIDVLNRAVDEGLGDVEVLELLGGAYARTGQTALAVQALDKAAALAGDDANTLTRIASARLGMGDGGGAERDLVRSLELAPDKMDARERLVIAALAAGDVGQSVMALEKLHAGSEDHPVRTRNLEGLVQLAGFDLGAAQAAFEAALRADPSSVATRLNLARTLVLQDRPADAEALLTAVLDKEPANTAVLSALSGILLPQNRAERMVALLEAARRATMPTNFVLTAALAELLARAGEPRKAYDLLQQLPRDHGAEPAVLRLRARLQSVLSMDKEALDSYRQILLAVPRDVETRRRLADLLVRANDTTEARRVLRNGLDVLPGNLALLRAYVAIDFHAGGLDAALPTARMLAQETANLPAARQLKGDLYMSARRYADAAAAYDSELRASPSETLAIAKAVALEATGGDAGATGVLEDWIARHPDAVEARKMLAFLDIQRHRLTDAEANLLAVLAIRPNDPVALNNLAWTYQILGDRRARAMAQKAYLLAPGPQAADTLGWILSTQGEPAKGLLLLRQAATQQRSDPTVLYHLAATLKAIGQTESAVALLTPLVASSAEFDDRSAARRLLQELGGAANESNISQTGDNLPIKSLAGAKH